ncbi:MAG TPA: DUF4835 family protein [Bacteroidales bacterium]|jgi:hypothetical protein|nr:DUF4835 family protein [Bacteroidales bacterium]MDI9572912.1 DUF4835 family protein [Bacteroidota bacterium]OQC58847.1 MAG: hypothetical protein BWX51_01849 [Bacteroidetes bacterium ADurb.Bin012]MBP9510885.1 DUF4835 family protein [Bacteroidales bacterium]MBP9587783.1 DUF4835 family protein [Bacteroidales bacterium]
MRRFGIFIGILLLSIASIGQELDCQISVSTRQVEGTDRQVYNTLQTALFEFMNNKRWTNYQFKLEERIECTMLIQISERLSVDEFKGTMNVVLRRPVYKSSYNSILLNHVDKDIQFNYVEFEPLDFQESAITSNLTAILAYYAYILIGLDFDSFSLYGGTPFYEKAQTIVNMAQNLPQKGWKSFESMRNRYWLAENFNNTSYNKIRQFIYQYHRQGLDLMAENVDQGRTNIIESLELMRQAYRDKPNSFLLQLILDAKRDEFINILTGAPDQDKVKAVNLLKEIDPANSTKYQTVLTK